MKTDSVYVNKSNINGKGVFAQKKFKLGEVVLHWDINNTLSATEFKKLSEKEKGYVTFLGGKYIVMQEPEKFVNHSCSPNTTVKDFCDVAIRNIGNDEEITGNYSEDLPSKTEVRCTCGNTNCKKIIKCPKIVNR